MASMSTIITNITRLAFVPMTKPKCFEDNSVNINSSYNTRSVKLKFTVNANKTHFKHIDM